LKNLLQEAGIPPGERERLPLVYGVKEEGVVAHPLLAVMGLGIAAGCAVESGEMGWLVVSK
jgi:tRNA(Ile)-lysidine synthase